MTKPKSNEIKAGHTPGPWDIETIDNVTVVLNSKGKDHVAVLTSSQKTKSEYEANARLIAAAPDLLSALELLVESFPELATDEELNGADVIEHLAIHWSTFIRAIEQATGEAGARSSDSSPEGGGE